MDPEFQVLAPRPTVSGYCFSHLRDNLKLSDRIIVYTGKNTNDSMQSIKISTYVRTI